MKIRTMFVAILASAWIVPAASAMKKDAAKSEISFADAQTKLDFVEEDAKAVRERLEKARRERKPVAVEATAAELRKLARDLAAAVAVIPFRDKEEARSVRRGLVELIESLAKPKADALADALEALLDRILYVREMGLGASLTRK